MTTKTLGERIRETRLEKGLTQPELGKAAGVGKSAVSQWESGLTKGLKPENLVAVAACLGVNTDWLVTGKGVKERRDYSPDEQALVSKYRNQDQSGKDFLQRAADVKPGLEDPESDSESILNVAG